MKTQIKVAIGFIWCFIISMNALAQDEKPELILNLRHFTLNNSVQYLQVRGQLKANSKLQPLKDVLVQLYLDSIGKASLIGRIKTDEKGVAQTVVPPSIGDLWKSSVNHKFIAIAKANKDEETATEIEVAKSKFEIDTLNEDGTRSVTAKVFSYDNGEWVPAKDVEVKIGVERLSGNLKIGDDETYTTDSLGQVTGEFKLDSLPAIDEKGNVILIAKVEDNDQFGNLSIEKTVPWGKYYYHVNTFGHRSLSAARFKAPLWLLFMAYSIVAGVWAVIIYLILQIFKIRRLRKTESIRGERETVTVSNILAPEQL
jgi:hypothetical protein